MKKINYLLAGVLAALGALLLELAADAVRAWLQFTGAEIFFLAIFVLIEELSKLAAIRKKIDFQKPTGKVLGNCFWIGLGFGLLELGLFFLDGRAPLAGNYPALAAATALHILTAVLTGWLFGRWKNNRLSGSLAVIPSLALHFAFNYWIFSHYLPQDIL